MDWCDRREGDLEYLAQLASAIPAGTDERLEADAGVVFHRARRALAAGDDWVALLTDFRQRLGDKPADLRWRYRWTLLRTNLLVGASLALLLYGGAAWIAALLGASC